LQYDDNRLTIRLYGNVTHISETHQYESNDGTITERPLVTKEAFDAIIKELDQIKQYYASIGYKLVCEEGYTLCAKVLVDGKEQYVAGETDCIAVDQNGRRQLIDFKTFFAKTK